MHLYLDMRLLLITGLVGVLGWATLVQDAG